MKDPAQQQPLFDNHFGSYNFADPTQAQSPPPLTQQGYSSSYNFGGLRDDFFNDYLTADPIFNDPSFGIDPQLLQGTYYEEPTLDTTKRRTTTSPPPLPLRAVIARPSPPSDPDAMQSRNTPTPQAEELVEQSKPLLPQKRKQIKKPKIGEAIKICTNCKRAGKQCGLSKVRGLKKCQRCELHGLDYMPSIRESKKARAAEDTKAGSKLKKITLEKPGLVIGDEVYTAGQAGLEQKTLRDKADGGHGRATLVRGLQGTMSTLLGRAPLNYIFINTSSPGRIEVIRGTPIPTLIQKLPG